MLETDQHMLAARVGPPRRRTCWGRIEVEQGREVRMKGKDGQDKKQEGNKDRKISESKSLYIYIF